MPQKLKLPTTGYLKRNEPESPYITSWFGLDDKPVRTGLYQVIQEPSMYSLERTPEVLWCWFDAEIGKWGWAYRSKRDALAKQWRNPEGATQRRQWRGLSDFGQSSMMLFSPVPF